MSSLSAFAAVGLADLVVLGIGGGSQLLNLGGFNVLLVALAESSAEAWELVEGAGAGDVKGGEREVLISQVALTVLGGHVFSSTESCHLGLSEVLRSLLTEAGLEGVLGCGSDDTSEESEKDDLH